MKTKKAAAIPTRIGYQVPLTLKQFFNIEKRDEIIQNKMDKLHPEKRDPYCMTFWLPELTNAYDIEYNGHFGSNIFFFLDAENSHEVEIVAEIIKMYARNEPYKKILELSKTIKKDVRYPSDFENYLVQ